MSANLISSLANGVMTDKPLFMKHVEPLTPIVYDAEAFRQLVDALWETQGVIGGTSFKVTQHGAGDNTVDIAGGFAVIAGDTDSTNQGKYLVKSSAPVVLTMPTAPLSGSEQHRIVATIRDGLELVTADYDWVLDYEEDTGGGFPAEPDNSITLAKITRTAGTATILTAAITDMRPFALSGTFLQPGTNVCRVWRSLTTQISYGAAVPFDNESWDTLGGHDSVNPSRYTCKVAGKYNVSGVVRHDRDADSPSVQFFFNGAATGSGFVSYNTGSAAGGTALHFNDTFQMAVDDYVDVRTDNSPNLFTAVDGSVMNIVYVGV